MRNEAIRVWMMMLALVGCQAEDRPPITEGGQVRGQPLPKSPPKDKCQRTVPSTLTILTHDESDDGGHEDEEEEPDAGEDDASLVCVSFVTPADAE